MEWSRPRCIGDLPTKRSGHSFTIVKNGMAYLFGGIDSRRPPGPNNELFKLDMSNAKTFYWTKVPTSTSVLSMPSPVRGAAGTIAALTVPEARWKHSATAINDTHILIFGGYRSSTQRLNDVWVLDTAKDKWSQPLATGRVQPSPRGAHAAALVGHKLYIFGGYGGEGFARQDFNDLYALDLETWEWQLVHPGNGSSKSSGVHVPALPWASSSLPPSTSAAPYETAASPSGCVPEARSGHSLVAVQHQLVLAGGWNAMTQFDDLHIFDTFSVTWTHVETASGPERWGSPRWNHTAVAVVAVPHWKMFVFGGNNGELPPLTNSAASLSSTVANGSSGPSSQGAFRSDLVVYETGTQGWSHPLAVGTLPAPRADTQMAYDAESGHLVLFGGWASHWLGEVHVCRVIDVVGPPYFVGTITPTIGPLTGNTLCSVKGAGFNFLGQQAVPPTAMVRLACPKGYVDVPGIIIDETTLTFTTPAYDKYGPVPTEVRVAVGSKPLTNSVVAFSYFTVTSADSTVAFGPGLLSGCSAGEPATSFVIQARDASGANRTCGMDEFAVRVCELNHGDSLSMKETTVATGNRDSPVKILDQEDGTYQVVFVLPHAGSFAVHVDFLGTFQGMAGPIRGSPYIIEAVGRDRGSSVTDGVPVQHRNGMPVSNELTGPILVQHLKESTAELKDFCNKAVTGLRVPIPRAHDDVEPLICIKEILAAVDQRRLEMELRIDTSKAALQYLKRKGLRVDRLDNMINSLENAVTLWKEVQRQAPVTATAIAPHNKVWSLKVQEDVELYEQVLEEKLKIFHTLSFWDFDTSPRMARDKICDAERLQLEEKKRLGRNQHLCTVFAFSDDIFKKSADIIQAMDVEVREVKKLWGVIDALQAYITSTRNQRWADLDPDVLEEEMKKHVKSVKSLHRCVRWSDAYQKTDALSKDFMNTLPLIRSLRGKAVRPRHWNLLMRKMLNLPSEEEETRAAVVYMAATAATTLTVIAEEELADQNITLTEDAVAGQDLLAEAAPVSSATDRSAITSDYQLSSVPEVGEFTAEPDPASPVIKIEEEGDKKAIVDTSAGTAKSAPTGAGAPDSDHDDDGSQSGDNNAKREVEEEGNGQAPEGQVQADIEAARLMLWHLSPMENLELTFGNLASLNLLQFAGEIEDMGDQAAKEEKMENQIEGLEARWENIFWQTDPYKDTNVPLLKMTEDDLEVLENDQLLLQGMTNSRYKAQFECQVAAWQLTLGTINEVFISFQSIQRMWSYLEPLFIGSDEVKRELPEDAFRFAGIDLDVRQTLQKAWNVKNIRLSCTVDGLPAYLEQIMQHLELCQKSLTDFLDGRRRQFPRFYFVSEADLLDILSNGSAPHKILVHVPKIYLSTKKLVLDESKTGNDGVIIGSGRPFATKFVSDVGIEEVFFDQPIPLEGKVEVYMQMVLDGMKTTLFKAFTRSLRRYQEMPRIDWLMHKDSRTGQPSDPAQIVLLTLAVNYVHEVEEAFERMRTGEDPKALSAQHRRQIEQLSALIRLTQSSNLSKEDRQRVMVCITMDAHSRDIVERLCREQVDDVNCFQWQAQLKHKYRLPPAHAPFQTRDRHLRGAENGERAEVAICDAVLPYDYEYLGNGPRLVITALTDRIYVTATQALSLYMGCAPAGPAGTGKTETTKDLANALAKCCYVFNCSPEMDYMGLGNIFKGLASSGAWGCFDEFNRLVPEVLSVCSVQFKAVCDGIKADTSRIMIEGDEIKLDPTCGVYITMNPGYLGRSELPEGLKALFRPMTVMVPDLVLICENMLMAEGFVTANILASKFYGLYSLLRELLSKQLHYDWGLRAIKSVLVVAGAFKRQEPELDEGALLMRALRDFNVPKIVREDEVVFNGLLGDLFPNMNPPRRVDTDLEDAVNEACQALQLSPDETFKLKVVQLQELLAIRHCVFLMGPPGAGKSACWKTLAQARKMRNNPTKVVDLNPKAVKTEELYGYMNMATREWKDGLLSKVMRELGQMPNDHPKWILLDGDLDANWIESMNSVMDDNRMLTLASNERIPLKSHMRLIFEIRDLKYATPATVSRAGILYISTDDGTQWRSLIQSWLDNTLEEQKLQGAWGLGLEASASVKKRLRDCFETYCEKTLFWLKVNAKAVLPVVDLNLIQTLLYMLDGYLGPQHAATTVAESMGPSANSSNSSTCTAATAPSADDVLEKVFVYCAVWAFGSMLAVADDGTDYKRLFSDWWRSEWRKIKFPSRDTVFDYWLDPEAHVFEPWTKSPYFFNLSYDSRAMHMSQITVPTPETCSVSSWMQSLVQMQRPVMLAGAAGTGKTQLVSAMLAKQDPQVMQAAIVNFNFYTTAASLCSTMSISLEKKVGSQYGPPGNARLVYFMDDLNLPEVDPYNTQSAIALLRQHMEYGHVYDMSKLQQKQILMTQVVACLNPAGGSFQVNPRLQRWFSTFAVGLPGPTSLLTIYQTFLDGHLQYFDSDIKAQGSNIIKAAYGLHQQVAGLFRKTVSNFHYEFNIRHLSNVFQGLLVSQPEQVKTADKFVQLWLHESERVYGDRLSSPEDLLKYHGLAQAQVKRLFPTFNLTKFYAAENPVPLVFCHFADNAQEKCYDQVRSLDRLSVTLEDALREYNEMNPTMDLVLFEDALKHVARISRIILNEGGHALLVGVGGSGKQSLARLAAHLCGYTVKQIVISATYGVADLKEDLKAMYHKAGIREEGVVFLLTDSQITNERFLVYINDLLASGHIPDLFTLEEAEGIINSVAPKVKAAGIVPEKKACWDYFIGKIRKYLHVVLAFSPVGDNFRTRARKFPALVNCTVIDWFQAWPMEALYSVGRKYLAHVDLDESTETNGELPGDGGASNTSAGIVSNIARAEALRGVIERFLPYSFMMVNQVAAKFQRVEHRFVYTTPKSYLELLKLFGILLQRKRTEADNVIMRLANGLTKLAETGESVTKTEEDLKIKLEEAEKKKTVAEGIAETVAREKAVVEIETEKARGEKEEVTKIQLQVSVKQKDTETDLAKAEPAVAKAMAALDTLNKKDLAECKTMAKPPTGVDDVFAATMILLAGIHPNIPTHAKTGKVKDASWDACKKMLLGNIQEYIDMLKEMKAHVDNDKVPAVNWKEVRRYLALEHFSSEIIMTKNSAAAGLCSFVVNIVNYYDIVVAVEPKRLALKQANDQLAEANARLVLVLAKVADLQEKLNTLNKEYDQANTEKQDALNSVAKGDRKLNLAQRLTHALSSENERWGILVQQMRDSKNLLVGDVLLAAAFISYLGPFTKPYRDELLYQHFVPFLVKELKAAQGSIPLSLAVVKALANADGCGGGDGDQQAALSTWTPIQLLTTEAQIAGWNTEGLPSDLVSTENGVIVCSSARWPLLIDPQLQGIEWIRAKERNRNLQVVRLGQKTLLDKLKAALENGWALLIENLEETVDAVLDPVIRRAGVKRGKKQFLKVGDTEVEWHPQFRLYLHTKLSNPHFPPEIQAETTLVNFTVTEKGLEDQLMALVVRKERRDLAELGEQLVEQQNGFKIKMKELEDNILFKLATAQGDISEDVKLIEGLEETKRIATDIESKAALARVTQTQILLTSEKYRPVAKRASLLFFFLNDLEQVHTYYIYSLAAFILVFYRGMDSVPLSVALRPGVVALGADSNSDYDTAATGDEVMRNSSGSVDSDGGLSGSIGGDLAEDCGAGDTSNKHIPEMSDEELQQRCANLVEAITKTTYQYVCRGLFDRDKITIAFLLALRILVSDGHIMPEELDYLITPKVVTNPGPMGALAEWLPEPVWPRLKALENFKKYFNHLGDAMQGSSDEWRIWFDHEQPETTKLPGDFEKILPPLPRLILLRALRPDRLTTALKGWIASTLGPDYIVQPPFDMMQTFQEMSPATPMFFVLFPGIDPTPWVEDLGKTMGISTEQGNFVNISMGQGQEGLAEAVVERFARQGGWVMLQNCHLMQSWLPKFERLLEVVTGSGGSNSSEGDDGDCGVGNGPHPSFRCFISAEPPPMATMKNMPESLMQGAIKVANEAPADIKSNMLRAWSNFSQEHLDRISVHQPLSQMEKRHTFQACLFALCWFHSLVLGRKRFGPQGWSRAYSFNTGDLTICANVLQAHIEAAPSDMIPWDDLRYILGEIMYGGHITDAWDRRTCNTYLQVLLEKGLFTQMELAPQFPSPSPQLLNYKGYLDYIQTQLPPEGPSLFRLHANAEIGYLTNSGAALLGTVQSIMGAVVNGTGAETAPRATGNGTGPTPASSTAAVIKLIMTDLLDRLPQEFSLSLLNEKAKVLLLSKNGPFVVVVLQECARMNALLGEIRRSLQELDKGLKGQLNMSSSMEDLSKALLTNEWPGRNSFSQCTWEKLAWPSKKNLVSQFQDMIRRIHQLQGWVDNLGTPPACLWLPGLFNPTAYLTAVMQVTARQTGLPLDKMTIETHITTLFSSDQVTKETPPPLDGVYVHGLFIEGARWTPPEEAAETTHVIGNILVGGHLTDSKLKELRSPLPVIYIRAVPVQPEWEPSAVGYLRHQADVYECPVYLTSFRGPTYVFLATLRTVEPVSKWVLTGTALLMQSDD